MPETAGVGVAADFTSQVTGLLETTPDRLRTLRQLEQLAAVLDRVPLLRQVLADALAGPAGQGRRLTDRLLADFDPALRHLVEALLATGQLAALPKLTQQYRQACRRLDRLSFVTIETPQSLSESDQTALAAAVTPRGRQAVVTEVVKPALLGGVRVIVDDEEQDQTLAGRLTRLTEQLTGA